MKKKIVVLIGAAIACLLLAMLNIPYFSTPSNVFASILNIGAAAAFIGYAIRSWNV